MLAPVGRLLAAGRRIVAGLLTRGSDALTTRDGRRLGWR